MQRGRLPVEGGEEKARLVEWLSEQDCVVLETVSMHRQVIWLVAVQVTKIDGMEHQVVRYDNCHGSLHRHLLYEWKERREDVSWDVSKENAFKIVDEIKELWRDRRSKYLAKIGRRDLIEKPTD